MEITFEIQITVGDSESYNHDNKYFTFDYDITRQDIEDFAKFMEYDDALDLLTCGETDQDTIDEIKDELENNVRMVDVYLNNYMRNRFEEWLAEKYQDQVEDYVLSKLTINSERDLNFIINY